MPSGDLYLMAIAYRLDCRLGFVASTQHPRKFVLGFPIALPNLPMNYITRAVTQTVGRTLGRLL